MNLERKKHAKIWLKQQSVYVRPYLFSLIALTWIDVCLGLSIAAILAKIIAHALDGSSAHASVFLLAFAGFSLARIALTYLRDRLSVRCGASARRALRRDIIRAIEATGPQLLQRFHSTEVATMMVDQVNALDGYFARFIPVRLTWLLSSFIVLSAVAYVNVPSALIILVSAVIAIAAQAVFGIWTGIEAKKQFRAMLQLQTRFVDRVRGITTLVLSGAISHETAQLENAGNVLRRRTMHVLRTAFLSATATDLAAVIALIGLAVMNRAAFTSLAISSDTRQIDLFALCFAFICVPEFYQSFRVKGASYQDAAQAEAAAASLCQISYRGDISIGDAAVLSAPIELTFKDVTYSWRADGQPTLNSLSFSVKADEILVLDGPSGAGKSTIMELILGFVTPQSGEITINAQDTTRLAPQERARVSAWIDQRPVIFAGTLRQNILFADPEASEEALQQAVARAGLGPVIEALPIGLETELGEGGYGLSGGQVQRVAIARAFLKNAPLLLLDEPTAHLDPESEAGIIAAIKDLARGRTVVLSSHGAAVRALATHVVTLPVKTALLDDAQDVQGAGV